MCDKVFHVTTLIVALRKTLNSTVTVTIIISRKVSEAHRGEVPGLTELEQGRTDTQTQACLTPKVMSLPLDHGWRWTDRINDPAPQAEED